MIAIKKFMHAGLIVSDLQKSRAFYEGLLGLKPNPARPNFDFDGVWYDIGQNQIHLMVCPTLMLILRVPHMAVVTTTWRFSWKTLNPFGRSLIERAYPTA